MEIIPAIPMKYESSPYSFGKRKLAIRSQNKAEKPFPIVSATPTETRPFGRLFLNS